jgi:hypothetical protein
MNLYMTAEGRFVGTQAEAKKSGKGWTAAIVPTDKDGLIAYLNDRAEGPAPIELEPGDEPLATAPEVKAAPAANPALRTSWTAHEIESFLLHEASVAQCENLFACLGTRFAELRKGA